MNANLIFCTRRFETSQFGEAHYFSRGNNLDDFEEYVKQVATGEIEDEPARPFSRIIAGRQWTDSDGNQWSAFALQDHTSDEEP